MTKKLNPNDAPTGYVAVAAKQGCGGCAFLLPNRQCAMAPNDGCMAFARRDGHSVIFIKRETTPAEPAPLDTRYTLRLPTAVKAKAQRIGAAAVIAAIEAVQE